MMMPVFAVVKKDLKSFLTNPLFYVLAGICLTLWGAFFAFELFTFVTRSSQLATTVKEAGLNIHHHFIADYIVIVHYVLVFIIAALSLRFFAEEKKLKTFPILLTSPMTSWQIVLAKWLAGAIIVFLLLAISAIYPLSLFFFTSLPMDLFILSYVGIFIVLCVYMSAAVVASAMTESLIVSVVLALVFNILLLLLGVGREFTESLMLQDFFSFLSFDQHFAWFRQGVFNLSSMVYFLSWSFFFGLITERIIEFHRWQ